MPSYLRPREAGGTFFFTVVTFDRSWGNKILCRVGTAHHNSFRKMSTYLRSRRPGGTFFFTVVTFQRRRLFENPENSEILSNIISEVQTDYPFTLDAWVFLPDHLHCLWTLPPDEADYSKRWGLIKAKFTKAISQESGRSALLTGSKIRQPGKHHLAAAVLGAPD